MRNKVEVGTEHFRRWFCFHPPVKIALGAKITFGEIVLKLSATVAV
jgi:hypothetical protein